MARSQQRRPRVPAPGLRPVPDETVDPAELAEIESLVGDWLTVPDIADRMGTDIMKVRRLLGDGELAGIRIGGVLKIPALFLVEGPAGRPAAPLQDLRGTLTVLQDARYSSADALRWLWTPDVTLREGRPIATLVAGRKTEIRRRAQALGF